MRFDHFNEESAGAMFRPTGALYGYTGSNEKKSAREAACIYDAMTQAYGPAIEYEDWRDVVSVRDFRTIPVKKNSWYWRKGDFSTEIYFTNEGQMQYIALMAPGIKVEEVMLRIV